MVYLKNYFKWVPLVSLKHVLIISLLQLFILTGNYGQITEAGDTINCGRGFRIVVLGSSTAFGTGAVPIDSSFINKYKTYVGTKHAQNIIFNLATLGLTTYHVLRPTGYVPPPNRPFPVDVDRNITKALTLNPDAIFINLPSNDVALGIPQQESKDNYEATMVLANAANIPVWVTTTQPRNSLSPQERIFQMEFRDWTFQRFGTKAIDFWTDIANPDGTISPLYNFDGVHVNNLGHTVFYERTLNERILDSLCLRANIVLPLKLISFRALKQNDKVVLKWETESEADVSYYSIEKSFDNLRWDALLQTSANNTPGRHSYTNADYHPASGINFYRLKSIDRDSSYSYSRILKVDLSNDFTLSVSPNPVNSEFVIRSDKSITAITLMDTHGRIVKEFKPSFSNRYQISGFAAGIYVLKVRAGDTSKTIKLVIQ